VKAARDLADFGIDMGNIVKVFGQAGFAVLINSLIGMFHGLFYDEAVHGSRTVYAVKTRKILSYSNLIASASNVIAVAIAAVIGAKTGVGAKKALSYLDIGGIIVTIHRIITDRKFITEIKKDCCFNRFAFLVMSLGLIATFTACSSDNDSDIPVYSLKDVEGNYSGNMLTETAPSVNPQNYSFKEEQPQGATVTAEVKDNQIMIKKLPVDDLIKSIVGEEIGEIIIETLGDINYNIPYTAAFNDDSKGSILLQLKPEPLEIKYTIPTQVQTEGEEAPQITVKVTIEAEEKGQYTYKDKKLTFVIKATQVEVEGEPLENFSVTTFSFDMVKK